MVEMSDSIYGAEIDGVLTRDRAVFRHRLTVATTEQIFNKGREFIAVCRDLEDKLLGFCWFDRGGYTTYSNEEISNARGEHDGFMRIHQKRGFTVNGSYAWIRTEKGIACLK